MTPERADHSGNRWRLAGMVTVAAASGAWAFGVPDLLLPAAILFSVCLSEQSDYYGWRRGYLAREREELRAKAGESR